MYCVCAQENLDLYKRYILFSFVTTEWLHSRLSCFPSVFTAPGTAPATNEWMGKHLSNRKINGKCRYSSLQHVLLTWRVATKINSPALRIHNYISCLKEYNFGKFLTKQSKHAHVSKLCTSLHPQLMHVIFSSSAVLDVTPIWIKANSDYYCARHYVKCSTCVVSFDAPVTLKWVVAWRTPCCKWGISLGE